MLRIASPLRRWLLGLAPAAALVLALGLLASATHLHHDGAPTHDHCAVCSVSHSMAVPADEAPAPARPSLTGARLAAPPIDTPHSLAGTIERGRAPPHRG